MESDEDTPDTLSSFQLSQFPPASDPDAGTLWHVCFSFDWLPLVLGCLKQLQQDSTWRTDDPAVLALTEGRVENLISQFVEGCVVAFPGMVILSAGADTPDGYLPCDGAAVSRTTYAALFAAIGTTWGAGNGSTTFNVPDARSRSPIGVGQGSGLSAWQLGDLGGAEDHTLTVDEMPSHSHTPSGHVHTTHSHLPGVAVTPGELPVSVPGIVPDVTSSSQDNIGSTGGGGSFAIIHPVAAFNYFIKY